MEKIAKIVLSKNLVLAGSIEGASKETMETWVSDQVKNLDKIPSKKRISAILKAIDKTNQNTHAKVSCRSGCSHCCHQPIMITAPEVEHIMEYVNKHHIEIDKSKLDIHSKWEKADYYKKENRPLTGCVFLSKEGQCRIYDHRPATCRTYFVRSNPKFCKIKYKHKHPNYEIAINLKAEVLLSALWSYGGAVETLPKKVGGILDGSHKNL